MADSDDDLKRRYREIAREEPSSALDAAILAKARIKAETRGKLVSDTTFTTTGNSRTAKVVSDTSLPLVSGSRFRRWSVPLSLAAVLMLGIGVSLRMQFDKPGVETSIPNEYAMPERAEPAPATPAEKTAPPAATGMVQPTQSPSPAARGAPTTLAEPVFVPASPPASAPAIAPAPSSPSTELARDQAAASPAPAQPKERVENRARADAAFVPTPPLAELKAAAPATITTQPSTLLPPSPPAAAASPPARQRAKRESEADAAAGARALRKSVAADPERELVQIAKLREASQNEEADKALEEFRKRYPEFKISEGMWDRVRPR